jgi:hypothetical protein
LLEWDLESILGNLLSTSISDDRIYIFISQLQSSPLPTASTSLPSDRWVGARDLEFSVHRLLAVFKLQITTRLHYETNKEKLPVM